MGDHLFKVGIEHELGGLIGQHQRDDQADDDHRNPVVENQTFQVVAGGLIEILQFLYDRHFIYFIRFDNHFRSPYSYFI